MARLSGVGREDTSKCADGELQELGEFAAGPGIYELF